MEEQKLSNGLKQVIITVLIILFIVIVAGFILYGISLKKETEIEQNKQENTQQEQMGMANPASVYCVEAGGKLEMRTGEDGGVIGYCVFEDGSECEEWAFFRKECEKGQAKIDIESDTKLIAEALVKKDKIDLSEVKVKIIKDTGEFASGSILPLVEGIGGAYFFAAKVDDNWNIVASGNGIITCKSLELFPNFPSSMIPQCVNDDGEIEER